MTLYFSKSSFEPLIEPAAKGSLNQRIGGTSKSLVQFSLYSRIQKARTRFSILSPIKFSISMEYSCPVAACKYFRYHPRSKPSEFQGKRQTFNDSNTPPRKRWDSIR